MSMSTTFRSTAEPSGFCDCRKRRFENSNMPLAEADGLMEHSSTLTASKYPPYRAVTPMLGFKSFHAIRSVRAKVDAHAPQRSNDRRERN